MMPNRTNTLKATFMGSSQNAADFWHASDSDGSEQFDNVPLANEKYFSASNEAPYVREGALKWIRADRAQAERFRVEGRIALDARWRPIFATAIYTGLRRGELLALRKADVDLDAGTIAVCRSHGNATTKGGHADLLPIAEELHPYLRARLGFLSVGVRFSASRWKTPARG